MAHDNESTTTTESGVTDRTGGVALNSRR